MVLAAAYNILGVLGHLVVLMTASKAANPTKVHNDLLEAAM